MKVCHEIRKNTYYDSVTLMLISKELKKMEGIKEALVGMATDLNKELAEMINISSEDIKSASPNDFFVSVLCHESIEKEIILDKVDKLLNEKKKESSLDYRPATLDSALKYEPNLNLALISVPGKYAAGEARKALNKGLHVMLFSDNVSMEDERKLKELASEKGLLMMGPDCGTAIINNVPLAFANVVKKGNIGVVGASGTGTQEVTVLIDRLGEGVSQVIGTGGRDLKKEIGGIMMLDGLKSLLEDDETSVIVLISKPPHKDVAKKVLEEVKKSNKPIVVNFIGGDKKEIEDHGGYFAKNLEDAAYMAVNLLRDKEDTPNYEEIEKMAKMEAAQIGSNQKYMRGLFTGGTLADEAMKIFMNHMDVYSNIPLKPDLKLLDIHKSIKDTCIDLGDDDFTVGKPHPMIDPSNRVERLLKEKEDESVAVVLMDFVLGYGSNEDPVGEMIPSIIEAKKAFEDRGQYLSVVGSICGTENDPQDYKKSKKRLEDIGVVVMPSNAQAARLTSSILKLLRGGSCE
ncbi:FdrA family protein [Anaeromicrobium sediminis]|uniref:FdrA family protein n=2 Tax=Anaeromicrobium sediminis TaxID=1478221 RepID=A0A267MF48_9FIRM|nr:FdrA family protein [Anaeromicrobium sediminis]